MSKPKARKARKPARKKRSNVSSKTRKTAPGTKERAEGGEAPYSPRGWSLSTLPSVRRRLAQVCSELDRGGRFQSELGISRARSLIYGLSTIAGILKAEAELRIEERFGELEQKIIELNARTP